MILDSALLEVLHSPPPEREAYHTTQELEDILDAWGVLGAKIVTFGHSKEGRPIRGAIFGEGERTLLAWGYPHPDEPLGAEALIWLGNLLTTDKLPILASRWRVALILCADPDEAQRQMWFAGPRDALTFCRGVWRPLHLGWGVDYGFPLDWGPFWQPPDAKGACRTRKECLGHCGPHGCLYADWPRAPLAESLALAKAIDSLNPHLVASMHNTHTGGDYTYLLERERPNILRELVELPSLFGQVRQLGEPIDRGRRWLQDAPDLIHETTLADFVRRLERHPSYNPELFYSGNHSAAAYLEAQGRRVQFICPETTQFRHPDFGDTRELGEEEEVLCSVEERRRGRYEVVRVHTKQGWLVAEQTLTKKSLRAGHLEIRPVTRGMLGVRALQRRRRALHQADFLWKRLDKKDLPWHPYLEERNLLTTPGAYVGDRAQLIFRTRSDYRRPVTRAQAASFRWLWPLHTATQLGNFMSYMRSTGADKEIQQKLDSLLRRELSVVPQMMQQEGPRGPALSSVLARVLLLMQEHC